MIRDGAIVAFACQAGGHLAHEATAGGLRCFVGFNDDFLVVPDSTHAPWSVWMETAITGPLMTQGTIADVATALKERFVWIFKTYKSDQYAQVPNAPVIWVIADWNLRHLALVGDGTCPLT